MNSHPTDPAFLRHVLGHYPTGVCVISATQDDGSLVGMTVGSFTSVSLNPPLVAFFPDCNSTSWPKIELIGRFCVNVLSADQLSVCAKFASKAPNKFENLAHRSTRSGSPVIIGAVAWIDCILHSVQKAGDHFIVLGAVIDLNIEVAGPALIFSGGDYGRMLPHSTFSADFSKSE
jgi:3-hydroxy-9,10-secoandrosta-1,3,5(10)-triene-9,17-dione monooxygenase reductase component